MTGAKPTQLEKDIKVFLDVAEAIKEPEAKKILLEFVELSSQFNGDMVCISNK